MLKPTANQEEGGEQLPYEKVEVARRIIWVKPLKDHFKTYIAAFFIISSGWALKYTLAWWRFVLNA